MSSTRPHSPSILDRNTVHRMIFYVLSVLFMGSLGAMVDLALHPEISFFDAEHLIVGGISAFTMVLLLGALEIFLVRRKQVGAKLEESNERLRSAETEISKAHLMLESIVSSNPDVIFSVDLNVNLVTWNRALEVVTGLATEALKNRPALELFVEEDRPPLLQSVQKCLEEGEGEVEARLFNAQGGSTLFQIKGVLLRGEGGSVIGITGSGRDITERKRAEELVARLHQQNNLILSSTAEGIFGLDLQGRHTFVNPAAARMLGYEADELLNRPSHSTWHHTKPDGSAYPDEECPIYATYRDGVGHRVSTEVFWSKDGTSFPVEYSSTPIFEQGLLTGAVVAFVDITGRKRSEEEKLSLQRRLQQAQKMESLGVLAGGIAHDFNNLLTVVLGNAELALNEIPPMSPARGNLAEIAKAAKRAADISLQMLTYTGKTVFVKERVELRKLIEEMSQALEAVISKRTTLTLNLEKDLPPIQADPNQIRQIVMALVTNASEAIGERSGVIAVTAGAMQCDQEDLEKTELHDVLPPGPYVYMEVTDNGCGMDAATRSRIFEPFFSTKFTGRGLGLSVLLGIVRAHKGALKVYSEPGKGTTFKVLFPAPAGGEEAARSPKPSSLTDWQGRGTILLVDDEESLIALGTRMLEYLGFTVLTAADGQQAVNLYRERGKEIDLVLMDLAMPHMDGVKAFDEMRLLNPDARVLVASGYAEGDVSSRFGGKKPAGIIRKPYTLARLRETLAGLLPKRLHGEE